MIRVSKTCFVKRRGFWVEFACFRSMTGACVFIKWSPYPLRGYVKRSCTTCGPAEFESEFFNKKSGRPLKCV